MSRSTKKAIYKDVGHMKSLYWRIHRRTNKKVVKHWVEGSRKLSPHTFIWDYEEEFKWCKNQYILNGAKEDEATWGAYEDCEFDLTWSSMSGNLFHLWWETPEFKNPKELINDYDYSDFRIDYEYNKRKGYYFGYYADNLSEEWYRERGEQAKIHSRK